MIRQNLGTIEMGSLLAITLERLENHDGIEFVLTRHGFSTRFWVTRLHGCYHVASDLYAPQMADINPEYPGERFGDIEGVLAEIDSQLDK